ncbi:MAG: LysM peptidoglycan-binding domain-containing protein, partial [Prevotella nanceiensis]|nr:LysM peptidoglycan-binding domain-containing protein [Hoylesella nanceiensis]
MNRLFKYLLLLVFIGSSATLFAQKSKLRDMYQVKKKDTIYGIAKMYGLTVDELVRANPEMTQPDYVLKKDSYIMIPFHQEEAVAAPVKANTNAPKVQTVATSSKNVTIGVMLPLHNNDGDGRRMLEYYRGMLMACDSLKLQNISVQVNTWNVDINADIKQFLSEPNLDKCDIIFGPLY